jgi:hypothetical protein
VSGLPPSSFFYNLAISSLIFGVIMFVIAEVRR